MHLPIGEAQKKVKKMATENNDNVKLSATTVNGTDGREAHSKCWVAALVQVRSEKAVGKKLQVYRKLRSNTMGNPSVERP